MLTIVWIANITSEKFRLIIIYAVQFGSESGSYPTKQQESEQPKRMSSSRFAKKAVSGLVMLPQTSQGVSHLRALSRFLGDGNGDFMPVFLAEV